MINVLHRLSVTNATLKVPILNQIIYSECDSGLGSASDSGRGKSSTKSEGSSEGSASETEKCPEEIENIKRLKSLVRKSEPITVAPSVTTVTEVQLEVSLISFEQSF